MKNKANDFRIGILLTLSLIGHFYLLSRIGAGGIKEGLSAGRLIQVEIMALERSFGDEVEKVPKLDFARNSLAEAEFKDSEVMVQEDFLEKTDNQSEPEENLGSGQEEIGDEPGTGALNSSQQAGLYSDFPYPRCAICPKPKYPLVAKAQGLSGSVKFRLTINPQGEVIKEELLISSGHKVLDQSAEKAILKWRFYPAVYGGKKGYGQVIVNVEFKLEEPKVLTFSQ